MGVTAVIPQAPGSFERMSKVDPTAAVLKQAIRRGCVVLSVVMGRLKREAGLRGARTCAEFERLLTRAATLVENLRRLQEQVEKPMLVIERPQTVAPGGGTFRGKPGAIQVGDRIVPPELLAAELSA